MYPLTSNSIPLLSSMDENPPITLIVEQNKQGSFVLKKWYNLEGPIWQCLFFLQVVVSTPTCWAFWVECHGPCWWPGPASSTLMLWQPHWSTSSSWFFPNGKILPDAYLLHPIRCNVRTLSKCSCISL